MRFSKQTAELVPIFNFFCVVTENDNVFDHDAITKRTRVKVEECFVEGQCN